LVRKGDGDAIQSGGHAVSGHGERTIKAAKRQECLRNLYSRQPQRLGFICFLTAFMKRERNSAFENLGTMLFLCAELFTMPIPGTDFYISRRVGSFSRQGDMPYEKLLKEE